MEASLTFVDAVALFGAMAVLAAVPSVSVLAVTARAASSGFVHGACTALGVVAGDVLFILLALFGLALLVEAMGDLFFLVRYLGGVYLIWLAVALWRRGSVAAAAREADGGSLFSSFTTGLLITLADQKAVAFYLGFLPAFVNLAAVTYADAVHVILIAVLAVGGVKLVYACLAARLGGRTSSVVGRTLNVLAAGVMFTVGVVLIVGA
jgi:threonine/homoserine/homoserine lactone efflux protein